MLLYNICILLYAQIVKIVALWDKKAKQWVEGRKGIFERMARSIDKSDKILLTFFSPSGYEIRKNYEGADYIFYLPIDTPRNVKRFLDIAHPEIAIFVKYEFWLNYLYELKARNIRTFVISAIFRQDSVFFKWYGSRWRQALDSYEQIFVQNEESKELLNKIGFDNIIIAGDTRFDRVAAIAQAAKKIDIIEQFKADSRLFVAGSTWGPDEDILQDLINDNPQIKFIIAPHEMNEARINKIIEATKGGAIRYTQCNAQTSFDNIQVLILDTVGILSSVYGYASWSYIGGGFGVGIHNTLEAATFALPIAFGPNYHKFKEARDMVALGVATKVEDAKDLQKWFTPLRDNDEALMKVSVAAKDYTTKNQGATSLITKIVFHD